MKLLLDTHSFLWLIDADVQLPPHYLTAIEDPQNQVFLSAVSIWEATVKYHSGKLSLPAPAPACLIQERLRHKIAALSFTEQCVAWLPTLPKLHKDPFDRMLMCQCLNFGLTLVTDHRVIRRYPVPTL